MIVPPFCPTRRTGGQTNDMSMTWHAASSCYGMLPNALKTMKEYY
jgi:hypothetical protein